MTSWTERHDGAEAFYIRRLFRIAPMFWLAIPFYLWLNGTGPTDYAPNGITAWHVGMTATFLHGLHPETITSVVPGGWSVADEVLFYIVFPVIAAILTTWGRAALAAAGAALVGYCYYFTALKFLPAMFPSESRTLLADFAFLSIPMQITAFAAGALAYHSIRLASAKLPQWTIETALIGVIALIGLRAYTRVHDVPAFGLLFGAVATLMGLGAGGYLVNPVMRHLGKVSFSAYLVHFAVLGPVTIFVHSMGIIGPWALAVVLPGLVMVTTMIATVSFYAIEQPAINLGRRVVAWRRVSHIAAVSPTTTPV